MDQKTPRTDQSPAETTKSGGGCGGRETSHDVDARPEHQTSVKAPVTKSDGCCCGNN